MNTYDAIIAPLKMPPQVISISPSGEMSGLVRKKGQGMDLGQFGSQAIQRATLIEWDETVQKWYVHVLHDVKGREGLTPVVKQSELHSVLSIQHTSDEDPVAYFDSYDLAVKAEIILLDHYRKAKN